MKIAIALATSLGVGWLFAVAALASAQDDDDSDDSLAGALNAINRRQTDLTYREIYEELLRQSQRLNNEEINAMPTGRLRADERKALEQAVLDYLEGDERQQDAIKKRFSSSFRERIEAEARERDQHRDAPLSAIKNDHDANPDYMQYIQELYRKYRAGSPATYDPTSHYPVSKRLSPQYYYNLGYSSAGLRKRSDFTGSKSISEPYYLVNYNPINLPSQNWNNAGTGNAEPPLKRAQRYPRQSFVVNKRGHPARAQQAPIALRRVAKSVPTTDPHVQAELGSVVFGVTLAPPGGNGTKATTRKKATVKSHKADREPTDHHHHHDGTNGNHTEVVKQRIHHKKAHQGRKRTSLHLHKKSIDWSDYFGYDRNKKRTPAQDDGDVDDEWMMERYHKALAMTARKRNGPLRHHEQLEYYDGDGLEKEKRSEEKQVYPEPETTEPDSSDTESLDLDEEVNATDDGRQLEAIDANLNEAADAIVDDTLKYTGAHAGTTDATEIQAVKDRVIAQLASAYNIEKMRMALDDYKRVMADQRVGKVNRGDEAGGGSQEGADAGSEEMPDEQADQPAATRPLIERKRVSVARKAAVDDRNRKMKVESNDIKCTERDENCLDFHYDELVYIPPTAFTVDRACNKVRKACDNAALVIGNFGPEMVNICKKYQTCMLCGEASWLTPTRRCNVLYNAYAKEACKDDEECFGVATNSLRYFMELNRAVKIPMGDQCNLACPDLAL